MKRMTCAQCLSFASSSNGAFIELWTYFPFEVLPRFGRVFYLHIWAQIFQIFMRKFDFKFVDWTNVVYFIECQPLVFSFLFQFWKIIKYLIIQMSTYKTVCLNGSSSGLVLERNHLIVWSTFKWRIFSFALPID